MRRAWPFILIIAVAIIARVAVFRGFAASDDADYARVAWDVAQGHSPLATRACRRSIPAGSGSPCRSGCSSARSASTNGRS